jgi:hypothetical protein
MGRIEPAQHPRWRILRIAAFLSVVTVAIVSSLVALHASSAASRVNTLAAGQRLLAGQSLVSTSGRYGLYMQTDGNLVIYINTSQPIWASNTTGTGSNDYLVMQTDGNLVVYTGSGRPVWASNTARTGSSNYLVMQDDGNLVVYTGAGRPVWASNTVRSGSPTNYASNTPTTTAETICPGTSAVCQTVEGYVSGPVNMVCWQDATWTDGQSHRWFYIQAPNDSEGFVHAASVAHQITTPNCSTISWINAAAWAIKQDGQTQVPANAKNHNKVTYWSGWCWLFSYESWVIGAGHTPVYSDDTAQLVWNWYRSHGRTLAVSSMPPRGSLVFFSYGSAGHVAISLGDGWIETTQGDLGQTLPVTHKTLAQEGHIQLGYVPPNLV